MLRPVSVSGSGIVSRKAVLRVMAMKASTPPRTRATPVPRRREHTSQTMIRIFLIVVAVGLMLLGGIVVWLGAYPPVPHSQPIEKVLPNDKFQSH